MPDPFVAQLGRISGPMLSANLVRDGIDLTFRNRAIDTDLLFLNASDKKIGINNDNPSYTLTVNSFIKSTNITAPAATIGDLIFDSASTISTLVGLPINIQPAGSDPTVIFNKIIVDSLIIDNNSIITIDDLDIVFNPAGTGIVDIQTSLQIAETLNTFGNIDIDGDLSTTGNIIIGDQPLDIVVINTNLTQDIEPKFDVTYNIGSEDKRWSAAYINRWQEIDNIIPYSAIVNNSLLLGGAENAVHAIQPNQELLISPSTGITFIERLRIEDSNILNLDNTALTLAASGKGYYTFNDTNAIVFPSGSSDERPSHEIGDTRFNTELGYLEVFDGSVYIISIGPGGTASVDDMEEFSNLYALVLG